MLPIRLLEVGDNGRSAPTAAEAAVIPKVRESWLKAKAAARLIPCAFIGKHLRFSDDITEVMRAGARQPVTSPSWRGR